MSESKVSKSRNFTFIFYPDCPEHIDLMNYYISHYKYVSILHDKDVDENVELKKAHYHFVVSFPNPRSLTGLKKEIAKFKVCHTEIVGCMESYIKYMIHDTPDSKDKYQYDSSELKGDLQIISRALSKSSEEQEVNGLSEILDIIDSMPVPSIKALARYVIDNPTLLSAFKSYNYLICRIISESRELIKK